MTASFRMGRWFAGLVVALIVSLPGLAPAQESSLAPQPINIPGGTSYVYKTVGTTQLRVHVFNPAGRYFAGPRPAIVFFFGGGWTSGTVLQFVPQAKHLAELGMIAVLADYRVFGRYGTDGFVAMTDAASAMRYIRSRAAELGIDPKRIAAGGGSAGGHLALSTAAFTSFNEKGENLAISARPDALVLFNPAVDTTLTTATEYADRFGTKGKDASPAHHVAAGLPPMLIMHGTADKTVPIAVAQNYCTAVAKAVGQCTLVKYEGAEHGFFGNPPWYDQTVAEMDRFLVKLGYLSMAVPTPPQPLAGRTPLTPSQVTRTPTLQAYQTVANPLTGDRYRIRESDDYAVTLTQGGTAVKSFAHKSVSPNFHPHEDIVRQLSWTQFSFAGALDIEVKGLKGPIKSIEVLPARLKIPVETVAADRRRLKLTAPAQLGLIINGDDKNPLFIFASPMPDREPVLTDATVLSLAPGRHDADEMSRFRFARTLYFQPGVHLLDNPLTPPPGQRVYLDAGAVVMGRVAQGSTNLGGLAITGRGILSGQHQGPMEFDMGAMVFFTDGQAYAPPAAAPGGGLPFQAEISGITIADQPSFAIIGQAPYVHIANVNIVASWFYRGDGIQIGEHSLIEDTFLNTNDDAVKPYYSFSEWRRITIWQGANGAPVQFSWAVPREVRDIYLHDIDIIRDWHYQEAPNHAVFDSMHAGAGNIHDIRIENVTIAGPVWKLFSMNTHFLHNFVVAQPGLAGTIGNITFRNITVDQAPSHPDEFLLCQNAGTAGKCPSTAFGPFRFENLKIAGKTITSIDQLALKIAAADKAKLTFTVAK
jgi:acetyl esterase